MTCGSSNECVTDQPTDGKSILLMCFVAHKKKKIIMMEATDNFLRYFQHHHFFSDFIIYFLVGRACWDELDKLALMSWMC